MEDRFLFYEDEDGRRSDKNIHEGIMDDEASETLNALEIIQDHLNEGGSLEDGVNLYGDPLLKKGFAEGIVTPQWIQQTLTELESIGEAAEA
ncbi:hypothetical protein [Acanthopleuribacter pedis]|uniref:Uncharacterized protein n=1 Tax=Acanthopleuribacter pedis TaxID=442870 RepID=A0A8J7QEB2_9BACT|nr:hypothetical protein [Acanthopleuribacter pedis]MBO1318095.1 hypothetical protein [Acanthopleuribacter pedis]